MFNGRSRTCDWSRAPALCSSCAKAVSRNPVPSLRHKTRIVPGKAVNADAIAQRSLPKDKVPGRLRVKVFHRNSENAEGIRWNAGFEKVEDVAGENLRIISDWIAARDEGRAIDPDRRKHFHVHRKKRRRKLA